MNTSDLHPIRGAEGGPPQAPAPPRLGTRILGWLLMTWSLGLVSCQSLFYL